jgi:hypothetical protein
MEDKMEILIKLELLLLKHEVRGNTKQLEELIHPSFQEIGYSGKCYTKEEVLKALASQKSTPNIHTADFSVTPISSTVALLTYKFANIGEDGTLSKQALRSSLWKKCGNMWQIVFHQATATN